MLTFAHPAQAAWLCLHCCSCRVWVERHLGPQHWQEQGQLGKAGVLLLGPPPLGLCSAPEGPTTDHWV